MSNTPQSRMDIPNYSNYQPEQEQVKLRKRLQDLLKLGAATPETFVQTLLQIWQENERRRQQCMAEAEDHLRKYHALVAQSHAFSAQSSIAYSVINGYVTIEERRQQEIAEREKEKAENPPEAPPEEQAAASTNGQGAHEGASGSVPPPPGDDAKPSGGKARKKP